MPEIVTQDDPIQPASLSSAYRTTMTLMEVFRNRPAPAFAFSLCLATWSVAAARLVWPELLDPSAAGVCISPDLAAWEWRRLLHALWPLEPSYLRGALTSAALLLEGYALEHELGTAHFASLAVGLQAATALVLLYNRLLPCHVSLEATTAALAGVVHIVNPKVHSDGLDKSIRVPFAIEARWHVWALQAVLLLVAGDFVAALLNYAVGMLAAAVLALRDPDVVLRAWEALQARSFGVGASLHMALLVFTLLFMPLTASTWPGGLLQAVTDGRALRRSWWQAEAPGSPALLHLALSGQIAPQALFISKLCISFAMPLLLSPFRLWAKFYAGACLLLLMYAMNTPVWHYPHAAFFALAYLAWAFWRLPSAAVGTRHCA